MTLKKTLLVLVLFSVFGIGNMFAQSVKINFIRYKMIEYSNGKWENWPTKWSSSSAYAIISSVYDDTYKVAIYSYDGEHLITSICTFDPKTTKEKRKSQDLPYLNCYADRDGDQIWTNSVSLESLLEDVKDWEDEDAALYLWVFSEDFGMVFE